MYCVFTQASVIVPDEPVVLVKSLPSVKENGQFGKVKIYHYEKIGENGLISVEIKEHKQFTTYSTTTPDISEIRKLITSREFAFLHTPSTLV